MLQIDLRATTVPPGTRVWRLFPGHDYKFLPRFLDGDTAFLDLPSLVLPDGPLSSGVELLSRIAASVHLREIIKERKTTEVEAPDPSAFRGSRRTSKRSLLEQAVINFYRVARQGDYLIVPSTLWERTVYLGRFTSNEVVTQRYRYGIHAIPAREVKWSKWLDEGKLSAVLAKSLRQQHPFSLVERSRFDEVLSLVNGNYTFGDRFVSTIYNRKDDFLDVDSALIGVLAKLAAASCEAIHAGRSMDRDTLRVVLTPTRVDFTCSQEADIHSDGFTRLLSAAATPLIVAAVLATLLLLNPLSPADVMADQLANIAVVNVLSPDDPCVPLVEEATTMILNSVDIQTTYDLCRAAHDAKNRAGLDPSAIGIVVPPHPARQP